tara:strand:+ start:141 stop:398 length:258 start_codon:yes stop_codon:yes gene_type:complete
LAVVKSKIIDNLSNNFPNFLKKDLTKLVDIILVKIEDSLKKTERVELRDVFTLETKIQKARISRNPKTKETVQVPEKKNNSIQNV